MKSTRLTIATNDQSITVWSGEQTVSDASVWRAIFELGSIDSEQQLMLVADRTVWQLYGETLHRTLIRARGQVDYCLIDSGERAKTLETAQHILRCLAEKEYNRQDVIMSFGGGVITDLTGFCASVYMRGMRLIHLPTTLLAQIDAALGGKTGVNDRRIKNMIGSFYHPDLIILDSGYFKTLAPSEIRCGLAEMIKMEFLFDRENGLAELSSDNWGNRIWQSIQWKKQIVECDPYDHFLRQSLNFGHTIGHAIEAADPDNRLTHGEAVARGMIAELLIEARLAPEIFLDLQRLYVRLRELDFHLPMPFPESCERLSYALRRDKKISERTLRLLRFDRPTEIGFGEFRAYEIADYTQQIRDLVYRESRPCRRTELQGEISVSESKSVLHRKLILAILMPEGKQSLHWFRSINRQDREDLPSDVAETMEALRLLFAVRISGLTGSAPATSGDDSREQAVCLRFQNSGTSLRLLLPVCTQLDRPVTIRLSQRLAERVTEAELNYLLGQGWIKRVDVDTWQVLPVDFPRETDAEVLAAASSQWISGLLLASILAPRLRLIRIGPNPVSLPYLNLTWRLIRENSGDDPICQPVANKSEELTVVAADPTNEYREHTQYACWELANWLGHQVRWKHDSEVGSSSFADRLNELETCADGGKLSFDLQHHPDLLPYLAVAAGWSRATVCLTGIDRLRYKESDRVLVTSQLLDLLGIKFSLSADQLTVKGIQTTDREQKQIWPQPLRGGIFDPRGDHRLAMVAAIAATRCEHEILILTSDCVAQSAPGFWSDFDRLRAAFA